MNFQRLFIVVGIAATLGLSACSTTTSVVTLNYVPHPGRGLQGAPDFSLGQFYDKRDLPAQTLGHVRLPIGTKVDTLQTRLPISDIVRNAFGYGLESRGMLAPDAQGRFILAGDIQDLRSQLLFQPSGKARIRVNVLEASSGRVLFSKIYEGGRRGQPYRPGSGSPVPVLRELTSRALQDAVDRALDDPELRQRIGADPRTRYTPGML